MAYARPSTTTAPRTKKEVDLLIVQDGTLYPVEIKRSTSYSANDLRHFGALQRLGMPIGPGGVICLTSPRHFVPPGSWKAAKLAGAGTRSS
jgi:hypothetical protein